MARGMRLDDLFVTVVAFAALTSGACGGVKAATIPPDYNLAAAPQNGVVIGVMDITGAPMGTQGISPGMSQSVKNTATGTLYSLDFVERGHKADFYVSLPAGPYRFVGGEANSGGGFGSGKVADWSDVGATFQVSPGRVTCVGAVVAHRPPVTGLMSALSSGSKFEFSVSDVCEPLSGRFSQKYPALAPLLVKGVAMQEPAAK